jgi:hypothetical protein
MSKTKVNPKPPSGNSNCLSKQGLIPCSLLQGRSLKNKYISYSRFQEFAITQGFSLSLKSLSEVFPSAIVHIKKHHFSPGKMELFISGDNQMNQNYAIDLPNDVPLSNFSHQFCQEF